jgi:hypothetical protein
VVGRAPRFEAISRGATVRRTERLVEATPRAYTTCLTERRSIASQAALETQESPALQGISHSPEWTRTTTSYSLTRPSTRSGGVRCLRRPQTGGFRRRLRADRTDLEGRLFSKCSHDGPPGRGPRTGPRQAVWSRATAFGTRLLSRCLSLALAATLMELVSGDGESVSPACLAGAGDAAVVGEDDCVDAVA